MRVHMLQEWLKPPGSDLDVAVQQQEILRGEIPVHNVKGPVVASRETKVFIERDDVYSREFLFQHPH